MKHPYSIQSARWKVVGVLMLAAVGISSGLAWAITRIVSIAPSPLAEVLGTPGVPAFTIFTGIYLLFNRHAWRWPLLRRFVAQPDLNGEWMGTIESSYENASSTSVTKSAKPDGGEDSYPKIRIAQTWSHIDMVQETDQSISESTSATFRTNKTVPEFVITYVNKPKGEPATELNMHEGTNIMRVTEDVDGEVAMEGTYYTDEQRNNHGVMSFERLSSDD